MASLPGSQPNEVERGLADIVGHGRVPGAEAAADYSRWAVPRTAEPDLAKRKTRAGCRRAFGSLVPVERLELHGFPPQAPQLARLPFRHDRPATIRRLLPSRLPSDRPGNSKSTMVSKSDGTADRSPVIPRESRDPWGRIAVAARWIPAFRRDDDWRRHRARTMTPLAGRPGPRYRPTARLADRVRPGALSRGGRAMEARVAAIRAGTARELVWLLEHPAALTPPHQRQAGRPPGERRFPVFASGPRRPIHLSRAGPAGRLCHARLRRRGPDLRRFVSTSRSG